MSVRSTALLGMALVVTACSHVPHPVVEGAAQTAPVQPTATNVPPSVGPLDASVPSDQGDDILFKPVPVPVQPPGPKPVRSFPTPPPPRETPIDPNNPVDALVASAIADLADRLGVGAVDIGVLDARGVTWLDGSIGCPRPGHAYTGALVPGWLVTLRVGETSYRYNATVDGEPFYCPTPQGPIEGSG